MSENKWFMAVIFGLYLTIFLLGFWRGYLIGLRDGRIDTLTELIKEKDGG